MAGALEGKPRPADTRIAARAKAKRPLQAHPGRLLRPGGLAAQL